MWDESGLPWCWERCEYFHYNEHGPVCTEWLRFGGYEAYVDIDAECMAVSTEQIAKRNRLLGMMESRQMTLAETSITHKDVATMARIDIGYLHWQINAFDTKEKSGE